MLVRYTRMVLVQVHYETDDTYAIVKIKANGKDRAAILSNAEDEALKRFPECDEADATCVQQKFTLPGEPGY